jgi:cell division protein FtsI/penicillin-binding protein 2
MKRRPASWRDYQHALRRKQRLGTARRHAALLVPVVLLLGFTFLAVWHLACRATGGLGGPVGAVQADTGGGGLSKADLAGLLGNRLLDAERCGFLAAAAGERALQGQTTIDCDLQGYVSRLLERSGAERGACVVLEPESGRILALASYDPKGRENLCLSASPAASLFKLVTAAAAIEEKRLTAASRMYYSGSPHAMPTRRHLEARRRGNGVTLAGAFACSVNPVFGELGAVEIGADALRRYGERFCFNRPIPFELALAPSHLEVPQDQVELARIASGFNRTTTISPLHAALLAAAVASGGRMAEPCLLERVIDAQGGDGSQAPLYTPSPATLEQPFSAQTALQLRELMEATVTEGTCRHSLLPVLGRGALESLEVGGKTGSISSEEGKARYDWFAGYALERNGARRLALAVFQVHGRRLGQKSPTIAGQLIRHYFGLAEVKATVREKKRTRAHRARRG